MIRPIVSPQFSIVMNFYIFTVLLLYTCILYTVYTVRIYLSNYIFIISIVYMNIFFYFSIIKIINNIKAISKIFQFPSVRWTDMPLYLYLDSSIGVRA